MSTGFLYGAQDTTGHYSDNQHQTQLGSEVIAGRVFGAFCG